MSEDIVVRRANVVATFLKAGMSLSKVDYLRPLLESGYGRLTYSTHMAQLIPFPLSKDVDELKNQKLGATYAAVIFDETPPPPPWESHLLLLLLLLLLFESRTEAENITKKVLSTHASTQESPPAN